MSQRRRPQRTRENTWRAQPFTAVVKVKVKANNPLRVHMALQRLARYAIPGRFEHLCPVSRQPRAWVVSTSKAHMTLLFMKKAAKAVLKITFR